MGGAAFHDGFELVEKDSYDDDPAVCTDDEFVFVEAPVKTHAAPHAAPPVAAAGNQAARGPETITGCDDQGHHAKTRIVPQGDVAPPRPSSPPPPQETQAKVEEEKTASPFSFYDFSAAALPYDVVDMRGVVAKVKAAAPVAACSYGAVADPRDWAPAAHGAYGEAGQYDDYLGLYEACYDFADFGRARRVKRSSGRRGRTKKATTKDRPCGEERSSHIAGNH